MGWDGPCIGVLLRVEQRVELAKCLLKLCDVVFLWQLEHVEWVEVHELVPRARQPLNGLHRSQRVVRVDYLAVVVLGRAAAQRQLVE